MARFASAAELESFLRKLEPDYAQYASALWQHQVRTAHQLANASKSLLLSWGLLELHVDNIKARANSADDREESFLSYEEFHDFLKFGNTDKVSQFAKPLWDDGHRSCRSVASIKLKTLEDRYGEDIRHCHSFCRLRIDMDTRAQLLQATLPEPKMSTSLSGLVQTEQPRASHPHKLETFDVTVDVLAYIDSLPSTKKRFKTIDTFHVSMAARESAVEKMWDVGIVEPANSLIGYNLFFGQNEESDGVEAFWQAQGNTTETHSEIVSDKQGMVSSSGAIARQLVEQESRVETSQTFDYLLKTSAQASVESRCCSITEVKRLERLSLRGTHQPIDMQTAPNLPDIWSRRSRGVSTVLQSNVDAVIAQVNGYAAAHGIQYGMISNLLRSWVFVMDGCNNMKVSAAFRYDAMHPTILQIHTWVTAMSLRHKPLASWTTNKLHPASELATRSSKRLKGAAQSASDLSHHQPGKSEAKTPAKTSPGVSGSSQRHTATLALHANATSAAIGLTFGTADRLLTAAAKFDVDDVCGVVATGSTGPVYHARTVTGQSIALKTASLGSRKHNSLKHQYSCLMAVRSLWGRCVPGLELAGPLTSHGHGYGLGTSLLDGRHPKPGDAQLLPYAEEALRQVHGCQILINDLHNKNIVIVPDSSKSQAQVFFVDCSLSQAMPSMAQCQDELQAIKTLFK